MKNFKIFMLSFFLVLLLPIAVSALEVNDKTLSSWDSELDIYPVSDNGYIAANYKENEEEGISFTVLVKHDSNGEVLWEREFTNNNKVISLKETSDSGYVFIASDKEAGFVTVKLDSEGNVKWSDVSYFDGYLPRYVIETGNEGYLVYNNKIAQVFYIKYDKDGNQVIKYFDNEYFVEYLFASVDGGFITFDEGCGLEQKYCDGDVYSVPDLWIENYNSDGNENFSRTYHLSDEENTNFTLKEIFQLPNGDFIVTYNICESSGVSTLYWLRLDEKGNILWKQKFDETEYFSIKSLSDGSLLVFNQNNISKYDANGKIITTKKFDASYDSQNIILAENDDIFVKANGKIVKLNSNLELIWEVDFDDSIIKDELKLTYTSQGSIIVLGQAYSDGEYNVFIAKYDKGGNELWSGIFGEKGQESDVDILHINDEFIIVEGKSNLPDNNSASFVSKLSVEYTINKLPTKNGSFEIIQENGIGRIVLSPDKGYELDEIVIKDRDGNSLKYSEKNGEYHFELADKITVSVSYKKSVKNPNTSSFMKYGVFTVLIVVIVSAFTYLYSNKRKKRLE